jgi:hypothetical protein
MLYISIEGTWTYHSRSMGCLKAGALLFGNPPNTLTVIEDTPGNTYMVVDSTFLE